MGPVPYVCVLCCSASLGLVPLWGEAPGELVDDYKLAASVTDTEMEIMFGAYRDDSPNGKCSCLVITLADCCHCCNYHIKKKLSN